MAKVCERDHEQGCGSSHGTAWVCSGSISWGDSRLQHGLKHRDRSSTHSGETPRMGSHIGACRFSEATK